MVIFSFNFTQQNPLPLRILLLGPTAAGKTSLSLKLANQVNAEIISADSRQCYKYTDIGTAKPAAEELEKVKHYNISLFEPDIKDNAVNFYKRTMEWEEQIRAKDMNILYAGGSTLHLQSIIKPFDDVPGANEEHIAGLEQQIREKGIETLYRQLQKVDPEYARKMDGMNPQRIVRALDVWKQTGKPFSSFHSDDSVELPPETLVFGLKRERQKLYDRINTRVDRMFKQGFLEEVQRILDMGYTRDDPGLNTVGYKDAIAYLYGEVTAEQMVKDMKTQTRRYARRQLTWFRRWDFINWIDMDKYPSGEALEIIFKYLAAKSNKD